MAVSVLIRGKNALQKKHVQFADSADGAKIKTLYDKYSNAGLIHAHQRISIPIVVKDPVGEANLDNVVEVHFRWVFDQSIGHFSIWGLDRATVTTEMTGDGERLTKASGDALVADWITANGFTANSMVFEWGLVMETR